MSESGGGILREVAAAFSIDYDTSKLERGNEAIHGGVSLLRQFATAVAGAEMVKGIHEFVQEFTEAGAAVQQAADTFGMTTTEIQSLQFAAGQAGIGADRFNGALTRLSVGLDNARQGTGPAAGAFRTLGVHIKDANGQMRPVGDVLDDIAVNMDRIPNQARRTGLAVDLFGRSGARMVNVLHGGAGGLAEMRAQFEELGGGITEQAAEQAERYERSTRRMDVALMGVKSTIAVFLLPAFESVTNWITHAVADFRRLVDGTHVLQVAGVEVGASLAAAGIATALAWAPVLLPIIGLAAALAYVALKVDDMWTAYNGGDSAMGRVEGVNQAMIHMHELVDGVKLAWVDMKLIALETLDAIIRFVDRIPGVQALLRGSSSAERTAQASDRAELSDSISRLRSEATGFDSNRIVAGAAVRGYVDPRTAVKGQRDITFERTVGHGPASIPITAAAHPAQHVTNNHVSNGPVNIHIHGGNLAEVQRVVTNAIEERARAQRDLNHPRLPTGE